ncbi:MULTISPECIES: patatin-like protein [Streptomyces]|uniref:patatin-like protein n=1 Tax=Streptomyces TaxID=1883 RepID=UPI00167AF5CE|nr:MULTISPECIES: patatin-like protein [Streptomyces]MBD3580298.1 patatin-like protein [Streptomyces sp. KD18]GGT12641.1 hypothetical protein GCM10010286_42850 [Streptomyces toxytricini]
MSDDPRGVPVSELRLALAMRGGVSLAVWMGGACCETAALRAAAPGRRPQSPNAAPARAGGAEAGDRSAGGASHPGDESGASGGPPRPDVGPGGPGTGDPPVAGGQAVYRGMLEACGYRHVDVDVLAGTSAGGLNGVLMACHLVYGMPFGRGVRDLWLKVGDLEGLLRRSRPFLVPDSLLQGDAVFHQELCTALGRLVDEAPPGWRPPPSLRLILTATRLRPRPDRVRPTLGAPLLVGRSQAYFRFRHRAALTDFPVDSKPARDAALTRLAYAARASSSFPGAFEPARVYVGHGSLLASTPPYAVDMRGVSSETGHPDPDLDGCVELVDGGVLDNIPVAWAVRAIAAAPAVRPAERWLLFLQPVPPFPPAPAAGPAARRGATRLVRAAAGSFAVKAGAESLRDDALELDAAEAAARYRHCAGGVLPPNLDTLGETAFARLGRYRRTVGAAEAARLIRLLADPAEVTGPDALPLPAGPDPLEPLDAHGSGAAELFTRLREPVAAARLVLSDGTAALPGPGHSPLPLARTVRLLLDWVRAWEDADPRADSDTVRELRRRLYAARFAVATVIAARDRLLLAAYREALAGGEPPADAAAPYRSAAQSLEGLLADAPPPEAAPAKWEAWAVDLARHVTAAAPPAPFTGETESAGPADNPLWPLLAHLARRIGQAAPPGLDGYEALREAATAPFPDMADALAFAEVLLGPLRPDPLAEATGISFRAVSAADTSWATRRVLAGLGEAPQAKDVVRAKLSGNQLNNFAAFLSVRWRMSDWTWGRLDGAASLVSAVATDERLKRCFAEAAAAEAAAGTDGAAASDGDAPAPSAPTADPADLPRLGRLLAEATGLGGRFTDAWTADLAARPPDAAAVGPWQRARDVLTELRQREILAEELPLLLALGDGNRPPDTLPDPPPLDPGQLDEALKAFAETGSETVGGLLHFRGPRRAALRAGLLAWPAVQPAGRGPSRLPQAVLGLLKPLVWMPPLSGVLAPWNTLAAAALLWTATALATGRWGSLLPHVPVCLYAALALACGLRQVLPRSLPKAARLGLPLAAALGPPVALGLLHGVHTPWLGPAERTVLVGACSALAAAALLAPGTGRWPLLPPAALAGGAAAALVQFGRGPLGGWWGLLVLYAVLLWATFALPWLYPRDRARTARDTGPRA